ncbi:MAG: hypothetical protein Alpg2KO_26140 [Alphaproteobacteria bacterium]
MTRERIHTVSMRLALGLALSLLPISTVPLGASVAAAGCVPGAELKAETARDGTSLSFTALSKTGLRSQQGRELCLVWAEESREFAGIALWSLSGGHALLDTSTGKFSPLQSEDRTRIQQMMGLLPNPLPAKPARVQASMGSPAAYATFAALLILMGSTSRLVRRYYAKPSA